MAYDKPGLTAIATFGGYRDAALVANGTVGIFVSCWHSHPNTGDTATIGGNVYTITNSPIPIAGTDLCYFKVDRQVTDVNPIKILPATSDRYNNSMRTLPVVWIVKRSNRIQLREVSTFQQTSISVGNGVQAGLNATSPLVDIGTTLVDGDSGSPMVLIVNGELVLLLCAYSINFGPAVHRYQTESVAAWSTFWGITDSFTTVDLSGFDPMPTASPEEAPPEEEEPPLEEPIMAAIQWIGVDGNLSDEDNYDPVGIPGPGDTVTNAGGSPSSGTITCDSWDQQFGTIDGGTFNCPVTNATFINGGTFSGGVSGVETITGGTFSGVVTLLSSDSAITGGTFNAPVDNAEGGAIKNGDFNKGIIFASSTTYGTANRSSGTVFLPMLV
jgi:hypothetical protein